MAEIDRAGFGRDVAERLSHAGLSFGQAVEKWPELNKAMLSRAVAGKPLSAANYILVCWLLRIPVRAHWQRAKRRRVTKRAILKRLQNPTVTVPAKRETRGISP